MRTILFILFTLFTLNFSYSQDSQESLFTEEWHQALESDLEYIVFPNPIKDVISLRIYRGDCEEHNVRVYNFCKEIVYSGLHKREADIDLSNLKSGFYFFEVSNKNAIMTKTLLICF